MNLFNIEDNVVVLSTELRLVPEFRDLLALDKTRAKTEAFKWFSFIYFMFDYKSPYIVYSEEDRQTKVLKEVKLPEDFKIFTKLVYAIDKYLSFQETPTLQSLKATREGLLTASKVIHKLQQVIENKLNKMEEGDDDMDTILNNVEKLLKISSELPKTVNTLQQLEKRVKEEQVGESKIRGGGKVNLFEDPS